MTTEDRFNTKDRFSQDDIRDTEEFVYAPRSETNIPEEMAEHFAADGFRLRWVRWRDGDGRVDTNNVRRSVHQDGFEFVRPEELTQGSDLLGEKQSIDRYGECVCLGDLVLMKVKDHKAEARRKYYEQESRKRENATNELLRRNAIENGSKTVTRTGRRATYSQD